MLSSSSRQLGCSIACFSCSCTSCLGHVWATLACLLHTVWSLLPPSALPDAQVEESNTEAADEEPDAYDSLSHFLPLTSACGGGMSACLHKCMQMPTAAHAGRLPAELATLPTTCLSKDMLCCPSHLPDGSTHVPCTQLLLTCACLPLWLLRHACRGQ